MENQTQKQPTTMELLAFVEKAIDVAVAKGCYNKMEVVELVQSIRTIAIFIDAHQEKDKQAKPFKGK